MRIIALLSFAALCTGCSSEDDPTECGPGTVETDGRCVPESEGSQTTCGVGTREQDGECVPDDVARAWYELRTRSVEIAADGISKVAILAIGENADGTAARDEIVLSVDRAEGGELLSSAATLGAQGAVLHFRPCNAMLEPTCIGPVKLSMFLAADRDTPVATLEIDLVEPTAVYTAEPCLGGGSAMMFDGEGFIYDGMLSASEGSWLASGTGEYLDLYFEPADPANGDRWRFDFSTQQLGLPLVPGVYDLAERWPFETHYRPGMDVGGDGRGCNEIAGRFQVHDYERTRSAVERVTISFEQHCDPFDDEPAGVLYGCVHYQAR